MKTALILSLIVLSACSKEANKNSKGATTFDSESMPIENSKLKNCHFKVQNPSYSFGATIEPNPIICEEGVPRKVEVLTPAHLPMGLGVSASTLSLSGSANERVIQAPYDVYLENEAGYVIVKIQISIQ